jgi:hypothetical protein
MAQSYHPLTCITPCADALVVGTSHVQTLNAYTLCINWALIPPDIEYLFAYACIEACSLELIHLPCVLPAGYDKYLLPQPPCSTILQSLSFSKFLREVSLPLEACPF